MQDCHAPANDFIPVVLASVSASVSRNGGRARNLNTPAQEKMIRDIPAALSYL